MIVYGVVFWGLLALGLHWGEVSPKAATTYGTIWCTAIAIIWMLAPPFAHLWMLAPTIVLMSLLILHIFGKDPEVPHPGIWWWR